MVTDIGRVTVLDVHIFWNNRRFSGKIMQMSYFLEKKVFMMILTPNDSSLLLSQLP